MATSVSFTPDIYNVTWDAVSLAQVTFGLKCPGSGSYAATAYRVFTRSGSYASPTETVAVPFAAGDRYFTVAWSGATPSFAVALDRSMTVTTVGGSGVRVTFSSLNLNYTNTQSGWDGTSDRAYAWNLKDTGANKILVAGRLTVSALNPYRLPSQSTGVFITGTTMTSSEC